MKICLLLMLIGVIVGGSHFAGRRRTKMPDAMAPETAAVSVGI
jgi:hypothetical protein